MSKNKKIILISLVILVFLGVFWLINFLNKEANPSLLPKNLVKNKVEEVEPKIKESYLSTAHLLINGEQYEGEIKEGESVYDFMDKLRNEGKIDFTEKNYIGMGKLIEEINGLKNNNTKNWIYYVNEKKAEIGISNYKIKKGDVVSWKYEESY